MFSALLDVVLQAAVLSGQFLILILQVLGLLVALGHLVDPQLERALSLAQLLG